MKKETTSAKMAAVIVMLANFCIPFTNISLNVLASGIASGDNAADSASGFWHSLESTFRDAIQIPDPIANITDVGFTSINGLDSSMNVPAIMAIVDVTFLKERPSSVFCTKADSNRVSTGSSSFTT